MDAFLFIVGLVLIVVFFTFKWWYNSPSQKGKRGEAKIHKVLLRLPSTYRLLEDVVLKTNRGTTQIDHVVVSPFGVFAIETKNYRGIIYGDDNREQWTQIIATDVTFANKWWKTYTYITKNHFYNPVKQSLIHVREIKNKLKGWPNLPIIPIVVFVGNSNLSHVTTNNHVIYKRQLLNTIFSYSTIYLSQENVAKVIKCLSDANVRTLVDNITHVYNIKAAKRVHKAKVKAGICPECGGKLVKRKGPFGYFYGCSNYPQCKFTSQ